METIWGKLSDKNEAVNADTQKIPEKVSRWCFIWKCKTSKKWKTQEDAMLTSIEYSCNIWIVDVWTITIHGARRQEKKTKPNNAVPTI